MIQSIRRKKKREVQNNNNDENDNFGTTVVKDDDKEFSTFVSHEKQRSKTVKRVIDDPNRGFGLQDRLQKIYRKDCTIHLPFLDVGYISPSALLSQNNNDTKAILSELGAGSIPSSQISSYLLSPTVNNLIMTLGNHKRIQEAAPMQNAEIVTNIRVVAELTSTLKTIFKV